MGLLNIALLAALCAPAIAQVATIRDCNRPSKQCSVSEVQLWPCHGEHGCRFDGNRYFFARVDFMPNFSTEKLGGKIYLGDLDFLIASRNACDHTNCPTVAGENQTLYMSDYVNAAMLSGPFEIRAEIYNEENEHEFCCFKTTVVL